MTLLTIVQQAASLVDVPTPSSVTASRDPLVRQLYTLANEEGLALAHKRDWQALTVQQTFTTLNQNAQTGALPPDWDHFIGNVLQNRTTLRSVFGPVSSADWQLYENWIANTVISQYWRIRGNELQFQPAPPAGQTVVYEYITKNWVLGNPAVPKPRFDSDNDTALLDENLIAYGVRWRFLKAKGLDYAEDLRTYEIEYEKLAAREQGSPTLSMASSYGNGYWGFGVRVPEGSWGQS